jgi:hypothetical protein
MLFISLPELEADLIIGEINTPSVRECFRVCAEKYLH